MMTQTLNEIKERDKKTYQLILAVAGGLFLFFLILIGLFIKQFFVEKDLKSSFEKLSQYEARFEKHNVPSFERLNFQKTQLASAKKIYEMLPQNLLIEKLPGVPPSQNNPSLEFKERLFSFKEELKKKALKREIRFPEEYGFNDYETRLPSTEDLPELYHKLNIIEELTEIIFSQSKLSIVRISFSETVETNFSNADPISFKERLVQLSLRGRHEHFIAFINGLSKTKNLYQIHAVSVVPTEGEEAKPGELDMNFVLREFKINESKK